MKFSYNKKIMTVVLCLALVACGGTTSPGNDNSSSDSEDTTAITAPVAAGITLIAETPELPSAASSADQGVTLTAIVRDSDNNVVQDQDVSFAASSGAVEVINASTQANGTASAILYTGGNPANRTITASVNAGSQSDSIEIPVTGTTIALNGPQSIANGEDARFTATLTDSNSDAIANQAFEIVSARGNPIAAKTLQSNTQGVAEFTVTGANAGDDTITASALGVAQGAPLKVGGASFVFTAPETGTTAKINDPIDIALVWRGDSGPVSGQSVRFSSSRGTFAQNVVTTDASGRATATLTSGDAGPAAVNASTDSGQSATLQLQFVATTAASIIAQADPATVNAGTSSTISATVRDANNNLVSGAIVEFNLKDTSGGQIEPSQQTTDANGRATATYTAGNSAASESALVSAQVADADAIADTVSVTVGGQALRITLGTGGELSSQTTTYTLPYVALVTDAAGNPVPEADFQLSLSSVAYQEGTKQPTDIDNDAEDDIYSAIGRAPRLASNFGCPNEDDNGNGILDDGEDMNGNGSLEPGNVASVPKSLDLDDTGAAEFGIKYPKNFSGWVKVRLRASASVEGSESTQNAFFVLPSGVDDHQLGNETSPPGASSPFGTDGNCATTFDPDTGEEPQL